MPQLYNSSPDVSDFTEEKPSQNSTNAIDITARDEESAEEINPRRPYSQEVPGKATSQGDFDDAYATDTDIVFPDWAPADSNNNYASARYILSRKGRKVYPPGEGCEICVAYNRPCTTFTQRRVNCAFCTSRGGGSRFKCSLNPSNADPVNVVPKKRRRRTRPHTEDYPQEQYSQPSQPPPREWLPRSPEDDSGLDTIHVDNGSLGLHDQLALASGTNVQIPHDSSDVLDLGSFLQKLVHDLEADRKAMQTDFESRYQQLESENRKLRALVDSTTSRVSSLEEHVREMRQERLLDLGRRVGNGNPRY